MVVQAVLLFDAETWVLLTAISKKLKGFHVDFLRQVTGKKLRNQKDRCWWRAVS